MANIFTWIGKDWFDPSNPWHNHDERYYTEYEIDNKFQGVSLPWYNVINISEDRFLNWDWITLDEIANILWTFINDVKSWLVWPQWPKWVFWKWEFNIATEYEIDDIVEYQWAVYISILGGIWNLPTNNTFFSLFASKWEQGIQWIKWDKWDKWDTWEPWTTSWLWITDKPTEFNPSPHTHTEDDIIDLDKYSQTQTNTLLDWKVDKVSGKWLSTNDYDNTEKTKVDWAVQTIVAWTNVTVSRTWNAVTINATWWGGGSSTLDWLTDVTITSPSNWQALTYDTATSQWINTTPVWAWDMLKSENLSWLANNTTARDNLWHW
jgi:hypothetical protein